MQSSCLLRHVVVFDIENKGSSIYYLPRKSKPEMPNRFENKRLLYITIVSHNKQLLYNQENRFLIACKLWTVLLKLFCLQIIFKSSNFRSKYYIMVMVWLGSMHSGDLKKMFKCWTLNLTIWSWTKTINRLINFMKKKHIHNFKKVIFFGLKGVHII